MLFSLIAPALMGPLSLAPSQEPLEEAASTPVSRAGDPGRVIQLHDVAALTGHGRAEGLLGLLRGTAASPAQRSEAFKEYTELLEGDSPRVRAETLAKTLEFVLEPELGHQFASFTATADGSALLTEAMPAHQGIIAQTLRTLSADKRLVDIQAYVIRVPESDLAPLMGGMSTKTMNSAELGDFMGKIDAKEATQVSTPRILVYPMAPAEIFVGEQVAYIADYESTSIPDLFQEIADPVISTITDGESLRVRAAPVGDKLRLRVRFESSHLVRPIPLETMRIGSGGFEVQVQRPELKSVNASATFDVARGSAVALGTVDETGDPKAGGGVIVILKAEMIDPAPGASGTPPAEPAVPNPAKHRRR